MKSSTIMPFFAMILAFAVSCGSMELTSTGIPQSADEIKIASQELIDAWLEATQDRDPSAMYTLLARNITDRCTLEQLEQLLAVDHDAFTYPELNVKGVLLDPANPEWAMMVMELRNEPRPGLEGEISAGAASLPYPIFREDNRWLMGLHFVLVGDRCPFIGETRSQEAIWASTPAGQ
ncbi:MAG: hypothetical protein IIC97_00085 [Chloroflexi bacterium]|nr:hypothetical protein [Chloroflexota bacterium]